MEEEKNLVEIWEPWFLLMKESWTMKWNMFCLFSWQYDSRLFILLLAIICRLFSSTLAVVSGQCKGCNQMGERLKQTHKHDWYSPISSGQARVWDNFCFITHSSWYRNIFHSIKSQILESTDISMPSWNPKYLRMGFNFKSQSLEETNDPCLHIFSGTRSDLPSFKALLELGARIEALY